MYSVVTGKGKIGYFKLFLDNHFYLDCSRVTPSNFCANNRKNLVENCVNQIDSSWHDWKIGIRCFYKKEMYCEKLRYKKLYLLVKEANIQQSEDTNINLSNKSSQNFICWEEIINLHQATTTPSKTHLTIPLMLKWPWALHQWKVNFLLAILLLL